MSPENMVQTLAFAIRLIWTTFQWLQEEVLEILACALIDIRSRMHPKTQEKWKSHVTRLEPPGSLLVAGGSNLEPTAVGMNP